MYAGNYIVHDKLFKNIHTGFFLKHLFQIFENIRRKRSFNDINKQNMLQFFLNLS